MTGEQKTSPLCNEISEGITRVLVVDDEKIIRTLLTSALSDYGLLVTVSENAFDAIKHCTFNEFHYIITDYDMPGMNGIEFTRRMRKLYPSTVIIGMSGVDLNMDFLRAGANDFLKKPFSPYKLANMLDGGDLRI